MCSFLPGFEDIPQEIGPVGGLGIGVPCRIGFGIVVPELDKDPVTFLKIVQHLLPQALIDETLRTASVLCPVVDGYIPAIKKNRQNLAPSAFRIVSGGIFISHGRITDGENGSFSFLRGKSRKGKTE
jgi:hypothetical protein